MVYVADSFIFQTQLKQYLNITLPRWTSTLVCGTRCTTPLLSERGELRHQKNKVRVAQAVPLSSTAGIVGFLQLRRAWVAGCFCVLAPATGSCPSQCQLVRGFTRRDGWPQIRQLVGRLRSSLTDSHTRKCWVLSDNLIIRDHQCVLNFLTVKGP